MIRSKYLKTGIISLICIILLSPVAALARQLQAAKKEQPLAAVLSLLTVQYKVNFLYEETNIIHQKVIYDPVLYKGKAIAEVLNSLLIPLNLSWYKVDARNYSIFPKAVPAVPGKSLTRALTGSGQDSLGKDQLKGRVFDEHQEPMGYIKVSLLTAADSALVQNVLTDPDGYFNFMAIRSGTYKIRIFSIGKYPYTTKPFTVGGSAAVAMEPISMRASDESLKEVKITSSRPLVETKSDRFIYNVENSAMAAGNSLQVLRSAPFVRISADNSVSLQGKKTMILIDGKPVPDISLENILQTMPAGNIQKIELITQPSAKYDASYGAVINIITKKSQMQGLTGNFRTDGSAGKYANGNTNLSATYKRNRLTISANAGLSKGDSFFGISSSRYQDPADPSYFLSNNWKRLSHLNNYSLQGSVDYQLTENQTLGIFADLNQYQAKGPWTTQNQFGRQNSAADSLLLTDADFDLKIRSSTYNFNYHLSVDSGKHDLTVLGTFSPWERNMLQNFPSALYDGAGKLIQTPALYQTLNHGKIDVYIAQADYTAELEHHWKLETGLKYQKTNSETTVNYEDYRSGQLQQVAEFSSQNHLQESIAGAYTILSKNWADSKLQAGLRLEDTRADFAGYFRQHYTNLFPTLLFEQKLSSDINVSASFKRTISRAPYNELVPYSVFLNKYTIEQGNPALVPAFDNIYSINTTIHKLSLSLSYTKNKGLIGLFPFRQDPATKVTYFTRQNLSIASDVSLYLFYPFRISSWWETINSGTPIGHNQAEGLVLGQTYRLAAFHSDFRTAHIFKFSERLKFQVDAYYWTDYVQDLSHNSGNKNIDASFLLSLWGGKGQLRLGGNELVFKRNDYLIERDYGTFRSAERVNTDSKRINIGFSYKFGKSRIQKKDTKLGNEDALKRL